MYAVRCVRLFKHWRSVRACEHCAFPLHRVGRSLSVCELACASPSTGVLASLLCLLHMHRGWCADVLMGVARLPASGNLFQKLLVPQFS